MDEKNTLKFRYTRRVCWVNKSKKSWVSTWNIHFKMLHIYFYIYIYHLYNIDYHLKVQCTDSRLFFFNVRPYIFYICRSAYLVFAPFRFLVLSSCTPIYVSLFSSKNVVEVKRLQSLVSFCALSILRLLSHFVDWMLQTKLLKPKCEKKIGWI